MGKAELKIDAELLAQAEAAGVPVARVTEHALRVELSRRATAEDRAAQWREENAEAIEAHREWIDTYGGFAEDIRAW